MSVPDTLVTVSDYLYPGEGAEDCLANIGEIFGWSLGEEQVEDDLEIVASPREARPVSQVPRTLTLTLTLLPSSSHPRTLTLTLTLTLAQVARTRGGALYLVAGAVAAVGAAMAWLSMGGEQGEGEGGEG